MTISYRTRLVAAAALVVAGVLSAVLALLWTGVRRIEYDRMDARLCLEARRLASQRPDPDDLQRLETDILAKLRLGDPRQLLLRIDRGGDTVQRSARWNEVLASDHLEWMHARDTAANSPEPPEAEVPPPRPGDRPRRGDPGPARLECSLATASAGATQWRVARVGGPGDAGFVAADRGAATDELLGEVRGTLGLVLPVALCLVAVGAWLLSAISIRPVSRLRDAMRAVRRTDLGQRLDASGEDREFQELIAAYNAMLERLDASFEQASRFSADAAHELRTPLTILQGRIEQAIRESEHRAVQADLTDMQEEIGRLASITRKLLLLSQADAGRLALHRTPVDLTQLLDALVADARMLVTDQRVASRIEERLIVDGDDVLLRQCLNNLVSNAVRYCTSGGHIDISARRTGREVEITFVNAALPLPEEARRRLFDRFYRLDASRNRSSEGSGLGLSIAREIARAHGGEVTLLPDEAPTFRLQLRLPSA